MTKHVATFVLSWTILTALAAPALGIIAGQTSDLEFQTPGSDWYGMDWSYNYRLTRESGGGLAGTHVAIGYSTLITARHFVTSVGDTLMAGGDQFEVISITEVPDVPGVGETPDLQVVQVRNNTRPFRPLPGFYQLYTGSFNLWNREMILVGTGNTGKVRSGSYEEYLSTRALRWGTNEYSSLLVMEADGRRTSVFRMDFRKVDTDFEAGYGFGDSGGGAFLQPYGQTDWKLAGINLYRDGSQPYYGDIYAASIPAYADWLNGFLLANDVLAGDTDVDGVVEVADYLTVKASLGLATGATWADGDFDGDGDVDSTDLRAVVTNLGYTSTPHPGASPSSIGGGGFVQAVPEPTALGLLAVGALAVLRRRPGRRCK